MVHSLQDIIVGKRATQPMKLPAFILQDNCPSSILREFLGGLYGGDGTAPYLTKTNCLGYISFKWTTIEKYKDDMQDVFNKLIFLHNKVGIVAHNITPANVRYSKTSIKPCVN